MGSKSSQASSQQTTQNFDQRQVNSSTHTTSVDDRDVSNVYDWSDHSTRTNLNNQQSWDNSIRVSDNSDRRQSWTDSSDRSQDNSIRVSDSSDRRQSWTDNSDRSYNDRSDRSSHQDFDNSIRVSDSSDRRQSWADSSSRSDSSQRNTTTLNYTGTDAGAAELLKGISKDQTDGIKTIAGFGDDALRRMGDSATSMYATAGSNATRAFDLATARSTDAWSATVEKSSGLIDSLLKGANNTVNAARDISQSAITSFQPAENKAQDVGLKLGMIAAAGVAVLMLTRKK